MVYSIKVDQDNIVTHCFVGEVPGLLGSDTPVGIGWTWDGSKFTAPPVTGPTLQEQRDAAVLDRVTFCKQLRALGVLPIGEASAAARGEWPATFAGFTAGLTPEDAEDAQIEWACTLNIHYTHPLLQAMALSYANGDQAGATAILDQIFGIT